METGSVNSRKWWPGVFVLVGFGLVCRLILVFFTDQIYHPDEIYQYLEQGHRLAFGYGVVPWEYRFGIRSWVFPGFLAGLLQGLAVFHLDSPAFYVPAIKIFFCVISLIPVVLSYFIVRTLASENAARWAAFLAAIWYELIYFADRPTPEILASYCIVGAIALLLAEPTKKTGVFFGVVCALIVVLRLHYFPVVAVLFVVAFFRWSKGNALLSLASLLGVVLVAGWLDYLTWGYFFASFYNNYLYNVVYKISEGWGRNSIQFYFKPVFVNSLGIFPLAAIFAVFPARIRKTWLLLACLLAVLVPHFLISHKEYRFIFAAIPLFIMIAAIGIEDLCLFTKQRLKYSGKYVSCVAIAVLLGISAAGLFMKLPLEKQTFDRTNFLTRDPILSAYIYLSKQSPLGGIINEYPGFSGAYYYLHRNVPVFSVGQLQNQNIDADRYWSYASFLICPHGFPEFAHFTQVASFGDLEIRKSDLVPDHFGTLNYDTFMFRDSRIEDRFKPYVKQWP